MPTSPEYAMFVESRFTGLEGVTLRKMFGEYVIHFRGKVLGFLVDEQLLLQDGPTIRKLMPEAQRCELFPGSKDFVIFNDLGNIHLLQSVCEAIYDELPVPKPRKSRKRQSGDTVSGDAVKKDKKTGKKGMLYSDDPDIMSFLEYYRRIERKT